MIAVEVLARAIGYCERRAISIRSSSTLAADPAGAFGIAPIKIAAEEQIQAIAFGNLDRDPQFVVRWNPLSRESGDLLPFAVALEEYLLGKLGAADIPRFWFPHQAALTLIELLGHRYKNNSMASDQLRQMGWQCWLLAEESTFPGQQAIAVATNILSCHLVTGQSRIKDSHLGSLLAWVDPAPGSDPVDAADTAALVPAASLLPRDQDDRVEKLRKLAKGGSLIAREEIETILRNGAKLEWDRLVRARRAFWNLGIPLDTRLSRLVAESIQRMKSTIQFDRGPATYLHDLSRGLYEKEFATSLSEDISVRSDSQTRARARYHGKALVCTVLRIIQPKSNSRPCTLVLQTDQQVLRVRRETNLSRLDGMVRGRVTRIELLDGGRARLIYLELEKGIRIRPKIGSADEWVDSNPVDLRHLVRDVYSTLKNRRPEIAYADTLPVSIERARATPDLREIAERLRRSP